MKYCDKIDGHAICLDIQGETKDFRVISVYAPNDIKQRKSFFQQIQDWILPGQTYILGDFNSVTDIVDRKSGVLDATSGQLAQMCKLHDLVEPLGAQVFTYQHPTINARKSCIDRIYIPRAFREHLFTFTQWCQCSDHSAVILAGQQKQRGSLQWKFPEDVLSDEQFCIKLKEIILHEYQDLEPCWAWELIKHDIMQATQEKTKYHRAQHNAELKSLRKALHSVNCRIYTGENLE